jgi:hypothetical protein
MNGTSQAQTGGGEMRTGADGTEQVPWGCHRSIAMNKKIRVKERASNRSTIMLSVVNGYNLTLTISRAISANIVPQLRGAAFPDLLNPLQSRGRPEAPQSGHRTPSRRKSESRRMGISTLSVEIDENLTPENAEASIN